MDYISPLLSPSESSGGRRSKRDHSWRRHRSLHHVVVTAFVVAALGAAAWLRLPTGERAHPQSYDRADENGDESGASAAPREYNWGTLCSSHDKEDDTAGSPEEESLDGSLSIPADVSFADLAAVMLPPYFRRTVDLCLSTIVPANETWLDDSNVARNATTSVMPGDVCLLRKTILMTRNLFDVFSPVYSPDDYLEEGEENSTPETVEDINMWKTLHKHLNHGYRLLGDFQDLDHANITYTPQQLAAYQLKVWTWHDEFASFEEEHRRDIRSYLSLPCRNTPRTRRGDRKSGEEECRYVHSHSSHLFWGDVARDELPDGKKDGATSALSRLGGVLLDRAEKYLREALACEHVIVRTQLPGQNATLDDGPHSKYHDFRKELRSFVDEVDLFGYLLLPGSSLIPEIERGRVEVVSQDNFTAADDRTPGSSLLQRTNEAMRSFVKARKLLGDLNDDYTAYSTYVQWNVFPEEQSRLEKEVEAQWSRFRSWAGEVELFSQIQFLQDGMDRNMSPRGKAAKGGSLEKIDGSSNLAYSLETFLMERKANPTNHVVIGNDAGDADTIISAISLAYIESMHGGDQLTPIVAIPEDNFVHERPDVNLLVRLAGIDPANLLFVDDLEEMLANDVEEGSPSRSLTLVDHNTLNPSLEDYRENLIVTEIVDHHKDEHQFEETCSGTRRNIAFGDGKALVASATTLVTERLRDSSPPPYPSAVGLLLLGVILLDSINLDESFGKVTQRDRDAVGDLLSHTGWSALIPSPYLMREDDGDLSIDTDRLFEKLQRSKYDPEFWSSLTMEDALGLDYKEFRFHGSDVFGIASILVPGTDFAGRGGFYDSTVAFMESKRISFLGIMCAFYDGPGAAAAFRRQLAFVSIDRAVSLREWTTSFLASDVYRRADLRLEEVTLPAGSDASKEIGWRENVILFEQKNVVPSRKQVGPMLEEYFDELK